MSNDDDGDTDLRDPTIPHGGNRQPKNPLIRRWADVAANAPPRAAARKSVGPAKPPASNKRMADEIEEHAARWVVLTDCNPSPQIQAACEAWLTQSSRHRAAFLRISEGWKRANAVRKLAGLDFQVDPDRLKTGLGIWPEEQPPRKTMLFWREVMRRWRKLMR